MVVWRFEIGELLAAALRYRHLRFRLFCIKIILKGIQKSEITDCDTWGCGMWDINIIQQEIN
jgi:glycerol kinase